MNSSSAKMIPRDCVLALAGQVEALSKLRGTTLLITGGTGFMGTWLCEALACLNDVHGFGVKIILLSRNANNFSVKAPRLALRSGNDITLVEKDVSDIVELDRGVNYVIHAAANPDSRQHSSDPLKTIRTIVNGTNAILEAASGLSDLRKILNVSSGLIYGPQPEGLDLVPETHKGGPECDSTAAVYAEAKRFAETVCAAYRTLFKLPVVTVRPFAFIGPYQLLDKPWAVNNFLRDCLTGRPIRILGDERTARSYMYPSDMAVWMLRILVDGAPGQSYNLGSSRAVSLRELAEKIAGNFPNPPVILSDESFQKGKHRSLFVPDTSLAERTFGLKHTVDVDEAIKRTILWHRSLKG